MNKYRGFITETNNWDSIFVTKLSVIINEVLAGCEAEHNLIQPQ